MTDRDIENIEPNSTTPLFNSLSVVNTTLSLMLIGFLGYLLTVTREIVTPIIIALLIFFVYSILEDFFNNHILRKVSAHIRLWAARLISIGVIIILLALGTSIVTTNVALIDKQVSSYHDNLSIKMRAMEQRINTYRTQVLEGDESGLVHSSLKRAFERFPELEVSSMITPLLSRIHLEQYIQNFLVNFTAVITNFSKNIGLIILYLVFLMLERKHFRDKIAILRKSNKRAQDFYPVIKRIKRDLVTYLSIKTGSSMATALLSFIVLKIAGVDFASFWAMLIFILNFIPTIGSIIAVVFPIALSFVQFPTLTPVVGVSAALIIVQQLIGNLIEPRILGKTLNVSPLVILISLGVWYSVLGVIGAFLAVPIMVTLNIIFAHFPQTRAIAILLSDNGEINLERRPSKELLQEYFSVAVEKITSIIYRKKEKPKSD